MKKTGTLALSIALILIAGMFASAGTLALFHDTETSKRNIFTAGTLDLKVDSEDDPNVFHIEFTDLKPGDGMGGAEHGLIKHNFYVNNVGTLDGELTITVKNVKNHENGRNEPERKAGDTGAPGELGEYLIMQLNSPLGGFVYYSCPSPSPNCAGNRRGHVINCWEAQGAITVGTLSAGASALGVLEFMLPSTVGNIIQSDSVVFDIEFYLEQAP